MHTKSIGFRKDTFLALVVVAAMGFLLGCAGDDEVTETTETTEAPSAGEPAATDTTEASAITTTDAEEAAGDGVRLTQECTNSEGFSVSYPEGWLTNEEAAGELPPCSLFDPESVELDETMHVPESIAIFIRVDRVPFEATNGVEEELDRRELTIDGRDAVRTETRATGQALRPEGMLTTAYRVDLDGETLGATTHDAGDLDYGTKEEVLDAMMETVTFE